MTTFPGWSSVTSPIMAASLEYGHFTQCFHDLFRLFFWRHDHHTSLTCQIKWLQAQHTADTFYFRSYRNRRRIQTDSHVTLACNLIENGSHAASCGIAGSHEGYGRHPSLLLQFPKAVHSHLSHPRRCQNPLLPEEWCIHVFPHHRSQ